MDTIVHFKSLASPFSKLKLTQILENENRKMFSQSKQGIEMHKVFLLT